MSLKTKKETIRIPWNRMASICIRVAFWEFSSDTLLHIQHITDRQNALLGRHLYNHSSSNKKVMKENIVTSLVCEWPPLDFNAMDFSSFSSAAKKTCQIRKHKRNLGKNCEVKILCMCKLHVHCVCGVCVHVDQILFETNKLHFH